MPDEFLNVLKRSFANFCRNTTLTDIKCKITFISNVPRFPKESSFLVRLDEMNTVHRWNDTEKGKREVPGEKPVLVPLCPPKVSH